MMRTKSERRRIPFVQQLTATDCGASSLAMVLRYHGRHVRAAELRSLLGMGRDGASADQLSDVARSFGMKVQVLRPAQEEAPNLPRGSILFWQFRHYVVLDRWSGDSVAVVDPARGRRTLPADEFRRAFAGIALVLEPVGSYVSTASRPPRIIWLYIRRLAARSDFLLRIAAISGLLHLFGLVAPLVTGVLVDRVIPTSDYDLFGVLAIGLAGLLGFTFLATLVRAQVSLQLSTRLESELALGFVDHLVALPYDFFQSRTTGDLMVRLGSNTQIREILTSSVLAALVDCVLIVVYAVVLLVASPEIAILTALLGAARVALLVSIHRRQQELVARGLDARSRTQTYQVEMLNGMETLKSLGAERSASLEWSKLYTESLNVSLEQGRMSAWFSSVVGILGSVSPLAILGLGASQVMAGDLTLGMMLATSAVAGSFLGPLDALVGATARFQLLGGLLERIEDVMETPREQAGRTVRSAPNLQGRVRVSGVSFRYDRLSPFVLRDVSVDVAPGTLLAIVGRSGSGKSTLGKLIAGLHEPTSGRVYVDELPLDSLECRSYRGQVGVVTQGSYLFSGSVRDNIALGKPDATMEEIVRAARLAAIHDDIAAMPMAYETFVATGGLSLSGGQRQRLALARALLNRPSILLLDEALNHLDAITEQTVIHNLRELNVTQIAITHRLSTIRDAEQILVMEHGRAVEMGAHSDLLNNGGLYAALIGSSEDVPEAVALPQAAPFGLRV